MTTRRPNREKRPNAPYSTGEIAELFGVSIPTVIRWIERGDFGIKGTAWSWTEGGPAKGERRVRAGAVRKRQRKEI